MKRIDTFPNAVLHPPRRMYWPHRFVHIVLLATVLATIAVSADFYRVQAGSSRPSIEAPGARVSCYGVYHVVRRGQTIYSVAATYGTTAYRIAICNGLASYSVYAGQALLVPVQRRAR